MDIKYPIDTLTDIAFQFIKSLIQLRLTPDDAPGLLSLAPGVNFDTHQVARDINLRGSMKHVSTSGLPKRHGNDDDKRTAERRALALPARLTWKDQRGATRFA